MPIQAAADLSLLRDRVRRIERPGAWRHGVVPLGIAAIDRVLPGGGLALGAVHEILAAGADEEDAAMPAGFVAALAARIAGGLGAAAILWCLKRGDLYGPGLAAQGLDPARLVLVRTARDDDILWAMEEGLRSPGPTLALAAVVGEVGRLPMVAGRRLQLAAERSGTPVFVLRRWHSGGAAAAERERPSAAETRWRVMALPSEVAAGEPGIGRPRWRVELLRCRGGGAPGCWDICAGRANDATNSIPVPAALADRPAAPGRAATAAEGWRHTG